jgi:3-hydroxyisobutyrate dehydrogenase
MTDWPVIGFIGLGTMGEPMALNLVKAGAPLVVWNRSASKCRTLAEAGAAIAKDPSDLFARAGVVFLMLANASAVDVVLGRTSPDFGRCVRGRTLVNMATNSPEYSAALEADVRAAAGSYVEAPVSGSQKPAQGGELIAMLAGEPRAVEWVRPLLAPMCRQSVFCGPVPNALRMKLAINVFLIAMVTGLAEAMHFAQGYELDLEHFVSVLDHGPMASEVSRLKVAKLVAQDFGVQAGVANVLENSRLITEAARNAGIASPLLDVCHALYAETHSLGLDGDDMVAVVRAIEKRTALGKYGAST